MEWSEIKTRWQVHRDSVAHRWQRISERELDRIAGDRERLSQRIQEVYCVSMDEAERQIVDWENECASWDPSSADGPAPMEPGQVAAHSQGKAFGPGAERLVAKGKSIPTSRRSTPPSRRLEAEPAMSPGFPKTTRCRRRPAIRS